jgi:3-hydroxyisobutyrate dehydrogenase-like beta-hydroxyacid dehydrogenase
MDGAVLGLGRMGRALAGRLLGAGHHVTVWNRTPGRAGSLTQHGAVEAGSIDEAVTGSQFVLTSLRGDDAVREVLLPDGQPLAGLDGVVIDCSTVSPALSREEAGCYPDRFVACPIAGAPQAVEAGTALLIVGGAPDAVRAVEPVLSALSESRRSAGDDPGMAALTKLINNYLLLAGVAVLADAVAAGQASGFTDAELRDLLHELPVVAPGLKNRIDGLLGADHQGWFSVDLGSKDLDLFATVADGGGVRLGVLDAAQARYREASALGLGDRDLTAVIESLRRGTAARGT